MAWVRPVYFQNDPETGNPLSIDIAYQTPYSPGATIFNRASIPTHTVTTDTGGTDVSKAEYLLDATDSPFYRMGGNTEHWALEFDLSVETVTGWNSMQQVIADVFLLRQGIDHHFTPVGYSVSGEAVCPAYADDSYYRTEDNVQRLRAVFKAWMSNTTGPEYTVEKKISFEPYPYYFLGQSRYQLNTSNTGSSDTNSWNTHIKLEHSLPTIREAVGENLSPRYTYYPDPCFRLDPDHNLVWPLPITLYSGGISMSNSEWRNAHDTLEFARDYLLVNEPRLAPAYDTGKTITADYRYLLDTDYRTFTLTGGGVNYSLNYQPGTLADPDEGWSYILRVPRRAFQSIYVRLSGANTDGDYEASISNVEFTVYNPA